MQTIQIRTLENIPQKNKALTLSSNDRVCRYQYVCFLIPARSRGRRRRSGHLLARPPGGGLRTAPAADARSGRDSASGRRPGPCTCAIKQRGGSLLVGWLARMGVVRAVEKKTWDIL